jgi:hypothetical protein
MIQDQPDISLEELQTNICTAFDVHVSPSTIQRELMQRGYSRKQATIAALERNEESRRRYLWTMSEYRPEHLVFCDESGVNRKTAKRRWVWARKGERGRKSDYFIRGTR